MRKQALFYQKATRINRITLFSVLGYFPNLRQYFKIGDKIEKNMSENPETKLLRLFLNGEEIGKTEAKVISHSFSLDNHKLDEKNLAIAKNISVNLKTLEVDITLELSCRINTEKNDDGTYSYTFMPITPDYETLDSEIIDE